MVKLDVLKILKFYVMKGNVRATPVESQTTGPQTNNLPLVDLLILQNKHSESFPTNIPGGHMWCKMSRSDNGFLWRFFYWGKTWWREYPFTLRINPTRTRSASKRTRQLGVGARGRRPRGPKAGFLKNLVQQIIPIDSHRWPHGIQIIPYMLWNIDGYIYPKIVVPQNGWFIMENPIKIHDLGVPFFLETPI